MARVPWSFSLSCLQPHYKEHKFPVRCVNYMEHKTLYLHIPIVRTALLLLKGLVNLSSLVTNRPNVAVAQGYPFRETGIYYLWSWHAGAISGDG